MIRHLLRLGPALARVDKRACYYNVQHGRQFLLSRHFSSEMISNWPDGIKNFLEKENISQPTAIQEKTLPLAMMNKDLVGIARTGSGKTLAFVIPAIMKILEARKLAPDSGQKLPSCLVLAPTRELAAQTADVFKRFKGMGIRSIVLVGGASRSAQLNDLGYKDHDVYIATPGRLLDLMESGVVDLSEIRYLVLDEADRMLDMGFEPQIRRILEKMSRERQTLMWSATWPEEIQSLANEFMTDYEQVAVDSEILKANPNISQLIEVCEPRDKLNLMLDYLDKFGKDQQRPRTLIFVNTKRMAEQLLLRLMRSRIRAVSMHGDRSQRQRDDALRLFKNQSCNVMVATDVAARGLDINDISHIINYDFPNTIEDYIHRIGRTARYEKKGVSLSFITPDNMNVVGKLINVLRETNQLVPVELEDMARNTYSRSYNHRQPNHRQGFRRKSSNWSEDY